jgi:2,4-diketo-3-deoxy-L-fuconate hydrolase
MHHLLPPIADGTAHVASAENYPDHQQETAVGAPVSSPFLFPKIVAPTGSNVDVARQAKDLFDYEVELCATFGADVASAADLARVPVGLLVCNDLSERSVQVRSFDPSHPSTAKGFTDGKSRAGFLPTGPYVVVPRDWKSFVAKIGLRLSLNGQQRQNDQAANMIWDIERQVKEALALGDDPRFTHDGKPVSLLPDRVIKKASILVSGTPGGVILRSPSQAFIAQTLAEYALHAEFIKTPDPQQYVKDRYVEDLRKNGHFLMPGDVIDCEADYLGAIRITVSGSKD